MNIISYRSKQNQMKITRHTKKRNEVNMGIKKAKRNEIQTELDHNNSKELFRYVKKVKVTTN